MNYRQPYTLLKRGDIWQYRVWQGDRRVTKSTGKKSKTEAKAYCDELLVKQKLGKKEMSFSEYANDFFADGQPFMTMRPHLAEKTKEAYRANFYRYIMPFFRGYKMSEIGYSEIIAFRKKLGERLSPSSVKLACSVAKTILAYATRDEAIDRNPFMLVERLPTPHVHYDSFTREEVKHLYWLVPDDIQPIVLTLAATGLRVSELYGLTDDEIKTKDGLTWIELSHQKVRRFDYSQTKSKRSRIVPIASDLLKWVICPTMSYERVYKKIRGISDQIKGESKRLLSTNSLRHFFITDSKSRGINPSKVEVIAGHSLGCVIDYYTNFKPEDLAEICSWQSELVRYILSQT